MTRSGLRWIDYSFGVHNRVEVTARRAVMTVFRQIQGWINEQTAKELGTDSYEVTWHAGTRPAHQPWQGKVWTMKQLQSVCGLGEVTGLHGANCYHDYNPFIPGVSARTYTDDWLDAQNRKENTPKTYLGKQYTTYEALQRQRRMETVMRKYRRDIELMKTGGAPDYDIVLKQARYRGKMQEYRAFSKSMGLPVQVERVYQDGLGVEKRTGSKTNIYEKGITNKKIKKKEIFKINRNYINSNEYKRKFNGITGNPSVDEAIYKYARAGLIHRDGTDREDLYILSFSTGDILGKNINSSESYGVKPNLSIINAVNNNRGNLIGIHNHPDSIPPTGSDFSASGYRGYNIGVVACHDGSVFIYQHSNNYVSARYIDDTIENYKKD